MSAEESAKAPRDVLEEIMLIAETTMEFSAMEEDELPENVTLALITIQGLAYGVIKRIEEEDDGV